MKKILLIITIFLTGCATNSTIAPKIVSKSLYLNKELSKFEMENGYCYKREPKRDGGYKNYWRSDSGNILANALTWDSYPYCELELDTNPQGIIKTIKIVEDDIKCIYALK
jgi:hypothetical protein